MVFSSTEGAENSAMYLSNCEVSGSAIRIDSDTHRLYIGKACRIVPAANRPDCVVATDAIYWSVPAASGE